MQPDADALLDQAFAEHLKRQPRPRPTNYQAYWFGLGVKAMRREYDAVLGQLAEARREIAALRGLGEPAVVGAGNGHGA